MKSTVDHLSRSAKQVGKDSAGTLISQTDVSYTSDYDNDKAKVK